MKHSLILLFTLSLSAAAAQSVDTTAMYARLIDLGQLSDSMFTNDQKIKEAIGNAEIVMLGEQSHTDGPAFEMKVKLVKLLHEEMGFDLLAFESGFYDVRKAWELVQNGERPDLMFAKSIHGLWSESKEFMPLADYLSRHKGSSRPLIVTGFDNQFTGQLSKQYFMDDFRNFLHQIDSAKTQTDAWSHFGETIKMIMQYDEGGLKARGTARDTLYMQALIQSMNAEPRHAEAPFWEQQLNNIKMLLMDLSFGDISARDAQMANNLIWIKENHPGKKIICWGATSHFLYNSQAIELIDPKVAKMVGTYYQEVPSMGNALKEKYGSQIYTIGFIAYEGYYGLYKRVILEAPLSNSLEHYLGLAGFENALLPLNGLELSALSSRPLGHQTMSTDIASVMDAVIFNRYMRSAKANVPLVYEVHPEYYWLEPDRRKRKGAKKKVKAERKEERGG